MPECNVCGASRSPYVMNNRTVCLRCDEIMFDIEIECEETAEAAPVRRLIQKEIPTRQRSRSK